MTYRKITLPIISLSLAMSPCVVFAGGSDVANNPIFGHAAAQKLSVAENKAVVGKGAYADYYGYYGNYYSALASIYGNQAFYYKNYTNYSAASSYAYSAYYNYAYASYYQQNGL